MDMMDNHWVSYQNGNYIVRLNLQDGTMMRYTLDNELRPDFPDSMDIKITNKCTGTNCAFCHEKSGPHGKHGDILSDSFINRLHPYTQIACGGGNVLEHPNLVTFLCECKKKKLIPSITVNQKHFMDRCHFIERTLYDNHLIYGLGVSLNDPREEYFIDNIQNIPNAVIHVINGIVTVNDLRQLSHKGLKILILGYKYFGRGVKNWKQNGLVIFENCQALKTVLPYMIKEKWFQNISFDNLALEQLNVKSLMSIDKWKTFYMGQDGLSTMYVDMVKKEFAANSTSSKRYPLKDNIEDMLKIIHQEKGLNVS